MKLRASILLIAAVPALGQTGEPTRWRNLSPLPEKLGVAGAFAGVSGGTLLVAGGANFPHGMPWQGGKKVWHEHIWVLAKPDETWRSAGSLPRPLGYGVSFQTTHGLLCVGGSDAARHYDDCFLLRWESRSQSIVTLPFPRLPQPIANACGAIVNEHVYVAGGSANPEATTALRSFYLSAPDAPQKGWRLLPPWPGPARMLAVAGAQHGSFFLFGGVGLKTGPDGKPAREWLRDAYRYTPLQGWKRLADLPRVAVAAPSPAPVVNGKFLIIGGDDGTQVNIAPAQHQGFPRDALAYDPNTDQWERLPEVPFSFVTTVAVPWGQSLIIPGGETRPGVRSPEVWALGGK
jgi:N-acetylneuraminate epimerase